MADALEELGWPEVTTLQHIKDKATADFALWLGDRRNSRRIPHRLEGCGYVAVPNEAQKTDGRWKIHGQNVAVYARKTLSFRDRVLAVRRYVADRTRPKVHDVRDPTSPSTASPRVYALGGAGKDLKAETFMEGDGRPRTSRTARTPTCRPWSSVVRGLAGCAHAHCKAGSVGNSHSDRRGTRP